MVANPAARALRRKTVFVVVLSSNPPLTDRGSRRWSVQVWSAAKLDKHPRGDAISAQARSNPYWTQAAFQHPENTPIAILTSFARFPGKRASTGFSRHSIVHGKWNDRRRCDVDDTVEKRKNGSRNKIGTSIVEEGPIVGVGDLGLPAVAPSLARVGPVIVWF